MSENFFMIGIDRAHRVVSGISVEMIARSEETNPCPRYPTFLHEEWKNIDLKIVNNLVQSMKSRCLAIIDLTGERIDY